MKSELKKTIQLPTYYEIEVRNGTAKDRQWKMKELIKEIKKYHNTSCFGAGTAPSGETVGFSYERKKNPPKRRIK